MTLCQIGRLGGASVSVPEAGVESLARLAACAPAFRLTVCGAGGSSRVECWARAVAEVLFTRRVQLARLAVTLTVANPRIVVDPR